MKVQMVVTDASFVDRVRAHETLLGTFAALGSPVSAEICGRSGFDWVLVDMEHGAADWYGLVHQIQALDGTPAAPMVRVPSNNRVDVTMALDRGAVGVMTPRIETADEAKSAATHVMYPPEGDRGVAMMNRGAGFGRRTVTDLRSCAPLLIVQIETPPALDNVSAIAATEGVDVLFVGPSDLSWSLGIPGKFDDPRYTEAITEVARAAAEQSKAAGVLVGNVALAPLYLELGYTFIGVSADAGLLQSAALSVITEFARIAPRV